MSAYLKFLSQSEHYELPVDLTAIRLLKIVACCARFEALTVTEAMSLQEVASPATLHRKLDDLMEANLIYQQFEGTDRRTKYLYPTQKALNHFHNMSQVLMQVAEELR